MTLSEVLPDSEALELRHLVEAVHERYGYDFRHYAFASLRRRLLGVMRELGARDPKALEARLLRDPATMEQLLVRITVNVTSMFRDPGFYRVFRDRVVPQLRTYPFVRIWHAGCSTGEEVYSLAILLQEEGLLDRCRVYATDLSEPVLQRAKAGIFALGDMRGYTENYLQAGGRGDFSAYYTADHEAAIFRADLRERLVFAQHNLVTDGSINEFNVILCRNVMIYFDQELQDRVHGLFHASLAHLGFLALGRRESLRYSPFEGSYEVWDGSEKVYRRMD